MKGFALRFSYFCTDFKQLDREIACNGPKMQTNTITMKKIYYQPVTNNLPLFVDQSFLASIQVGASGQDVTFQDEADFDDFFNS